MRATVSGILVGIEDRPYDFVNDDGERVEGHTRRLWLANGLEEAPQPISPKRDDQDAIRAFESIRSTAEFLEPLELVVSIGSKGGPTLVSPA